MKKLKYLSIYVIPAIVFYSFQLSGAWSFLPVFVLFVVVPIFEFLFKPDKVNLEEAELAFAKSDPYYDWLLYMTVPVQVGLLVYFLTIIGEVPFGSLEFVGKTISMGLMCGIFGVNIGHELGHRSTKGERLLGEISLMTSLEMHFIPYHNSGHHFNVATPLDPATARKNEWVYSFWFRSQIGSYIQAWQLEAKRIKKLDTAFWSWSNRMVRYTIVQLALVVSIYYIFGSMVLLTFVMTAIIGILLLETVNYIEHYGLLRKKLDNGRYERVQHWHSWNSDHVLGRILLFELSRHSDHHYKASKHYQILDSYPESPQMPTGYPGMVLFALVSPLWIRFMNARLEKQTH